MSNVDKISLSEEYNKELDKHFTFDVESDQEGSDIKREVSNKGFILAIVVLLASVVSYIILGEGYFHE